MITVRQQLGNICSVADKILEPGQVVVDFCSGGGHLSVLLAYLYPDCHFILVDTNDIRFSILFILILVFVML